MDKPPTADLYIRVSTDEQADKGYSQRNQEEMLRKYCLNHAIAVRNIIYEDHSAKSFNRPQWKKLLSDLKKKRKGANLILFTKWDRFSRNAGDAYQMISTLYSFGVEPQAIEQPLDLSIPENKMMLAFYLAAPEVENDRRALNVFYGMRRARKEGRYMGLAPVGYANKTDDSGRKCIVPKQPEAGLVCEGFEELSNGVFNTEQVWKRLKSKGLKCSKNAFWQLIRNPLYCGRIFIPKFREEKAFFVQGQHTPLISTDLFDQVQQVLDGRGKNYRSKLETMHEFPLKGFFNCPRCARVLTASRSKGRNRYYSYYHCYNGCTYRVSYEILNSAFGDYLRDFAPRHDYALLYRKLLQESYRHATKELQTEKRQVMSQIEDHKQRIFHIKDLLATRQLDPSDYKDMKTTYQTTLEQLSDRLTVLQSKAPPIDSLLKQGVDRLLCLDTFFKSATAAQIRSVLSLVFSDKLTFVDSRVHSRKQSPVLNHIYSRRTG